METLVVADQTMVDYHGPGDVEQYVLTLMNIVSNACTYQYFLYMHVLYLFNNH